MNIKLFGGLALLVITLCWIALPDFVSADPVPPECFEIKLWAFDEGQYPVNPVFVNSLEVVHPRDRISVRCNVRVENIEQELSTELLHINPHEENLTNNAEGEWRFWIINEQNGENTLVDSQRTLLPLGEYDVQVKGVVRDTVVETPGVRKDRRIPLTILQVESNPGPGIEFQSEIISREREIIEEALNGTTNMLPREDEIKQYVEPIMQPLLEAVKQRMDADEPRNANDLFNLATFVSERSRNEFQALIDVHEMEIAALNENHQTAILSINQTNSNDLEALNNTHKAELLKMQSGHATQLEQQMESQRAEIAVRDSRILELQSSANSGGFPLSRMLNVVLLVAVVALAVFLYMGRRNPNR